MQAVCDKPTITEHRRFLSDELARRGVRLLNKYGLYLECVFCRQTWSPRLRANRTLLPRFWECPNRCNW
jgi:hypothetical protein